MPPAFNLSQDQTLQFDLDKYTQNGIEVNLDALIAERPLRNILSNVLVLHLLSSVSVCAVLAFALTRVWHSPSNAHAYRLYVFKEQTRRREIRILRSTPAWSGMRRCRMGAMQSCLQRDRFSPGLRLKPVTCITGY
jgi:hypothetical protein